MSDTLVPEPQASIFDAVKGVVKDEGSMLMAVARMTVGTPSP